MLESNLETVNMVAQLGIVVEEKETRQVKDCSALQVLRDKPR